MTLDKKPTPAVKTDGMDSRVARLKIALQNKN